MPRKKQERGKPTTFNWESDDQKAFFEILCVNSGLESLRSGLIRLVNDAIQKGRIPEYVRRPQLPPDILGEDLKEVETTPPALPNPSLQEGYRLDSQQPARPKKRIRSPLKADQVSTPQS